NRSGDLTALCCLRLRPHTRATSRRTSGRHPSGKLGLPTMHANSISNAQRPSLPRLRSRPHHLSQLARLSLRRAKWGTLVLVSLLLAGCAGNTPDLTAAVAKRTLPPVS